MIGRGEHFSGNRYELAEPILASSEPAKEGVEGETNEAIELGEGTLNRPGERN